MDAMEHDSKITNVKLAETLGVTTRTIERNIGILKKKNTVERVGSDKDESWIVNKQS